MTLAVLLAAVALRLWDADLAVPLVGAGDGLFFHMVVKGVLDHGWAYSNPSLGVPFGQELYDYPVAGANVVPIALIKLLGLFTSDSGKVVNAFFLVTFPLVAASAYAAFRWLRVSRVAAIAMATLFAVAPYHFAQGESHLLLSAYFTVPVSAYLILAVYLDAPLIVRRAVDGPRAFRFASRRTLATLGLCALAGLSDPYYVAFTVLLLAAATAITSLAKRRWRQLVQGSVVTAAVVVAGVAAFSPNLVYRAENGAPPSALERNAQQSEVFSLNLIELLLPVPDHRIDALATAQRKHQDMSLVGEESPPLGLVAACGFLWLLAAALLLSAGARGRLMADGRLRALATANITAFLIGTTGGVSALIAYGLNGQLRTWSRMSIFIAFFSLAALALLLDYAWGRLQGRWRVPRAVGLGALAALVVLAFLDQAPPSLVPNYAAAIPAYKNEAAFVRAIEQRTGPGASVFQVPWVRFPDQPPFLGVQDYEPLRGYIHSDSLRWSYGAMKGRPADWSAGLADATPDEIALQAAVAGFAGIWVDRNGYADKGAAMEGTLERLTTTEPIVSPDARFAFYDIRDYTRSLRDRFGPDELRMLEEVTVRPLRVEWAGGFSFEEREGSSLARWANNVLAEIVVVNPSGSERTATVRMTLARPGGDPGLTELQFPDGTSARVSATAAGTPVTRVVRFPPGRSTIRLATTAVPLEDAKLVRVVGLRLSPAEVTAAAAG